MVQIIVKDNVHNNSTMIIGRLSPYSIINEESKISLNPGLNNIYSFKYGFYFNLFCNSENIILINLTNYDTSNIIDMSLMFASISISHIMLKNFNTTNVFTMYGMFCGCRNLVKLDLSSFDTRNVTNISSMFLGCHSLTELDLSNFDVSNVGVAYGVFYGCLSLRKIKCKSSFKEWCIAHQSEINLPRSMREGGDGIWEIID